MDRAKYTMLVAALAALGLLSAGCQKTDTGDKFGKSDQSNPPTVMGKASPDQNTAPSAQPAPPSSTQPPMDQGKTDQSGSSSDQDKDKAPQSDKKSS